MRLHSDFHDYYDNAIGYGIDEKVHYNRFSKEADIKLISVADRPGDHNAGILGFCGVLFPFIEISRYDKKRDFDWEDEYDGKLVEKYLAFSLDDYSKKVDDWYDYIDVRHSDHSGRIKLKQFFFDWTKNSDETFVELRCPVWIMRFYQHSPNGMLNPRLRDIGFDRIKDPFSAFQEISIYLANILVEQKDTKSVEDKFRIQQHGFDLKESFRSTKKRSE